MSEPFPRPEMSRRRVLGMGLVATGLAATGCKVQVDDKSSTGGSAIRFPDPEVKLPKGDVTFRWIDSGDQKQPFNDAVVKAYAKKHPNITIDYKGQDWPVVNKTVTLGIRNGSAPDMFAMPQTVPPATAVKEGWVQPIDALIPDFDSWRRQLPSDALVPGEHVFDDKVYTLPLSNSLVLSQLVIYDEKNLDRAGIDPDRDLGSWDAMRAAARKVTKGEVYGLMIPGGQRLGRIVMELAVSAGWRSSESLWGLDFTTGEYAFDAPEIAAALEHLQAFKSDGSMFPGYLTFKNDDLVGRMPNGVAGMAFHGPYYIPEWRKSAPDWKFGFAPQPPQQQGKPVHEPYQPLGDYTLWVNADSKYPNIAADLLSFIGSAAGQTELVRQTKGLVRSVIPKANAKVKRDELDAQGERAYALAKQQKRICPVPSRRNPDTAKTLIQAETIKPDFNEIVQGIFTGEIDDAAKAFKEYNATLNKAFDNSIADAKAGGAKISRDDWVFADWDPAEDYETKS